MRTVTYTINHYKDADTGCGDCFEVVENETLHIVGGPEEYSSFGIVAFGTRKEAEDFIETIF